MNKENYPVRKLVIERDEGLDINGLKMQGTGVYDKETETFEFEKTPQRQKSASSKNPAQYAGEYATLRLHKDGSSRITVTLHSHLIVEEVLGKIVKEVRECLSKL